MSVRVREAEPKVRSSSREGARNAIRIVGLTKFYGKTPGIVDLDLEVATGEVFGYLGPNGAGKTTTIRLLLDLIRPSRGRAEILGLDIRTDSIEVRRRIGYVPGELALYPNLTGGQLLEYFAGLRRMDGTGTAPVLAERLDIDLSRRIGELSTGNRQKIGLIQAWMHQPELIILDEPTTGLDPLAQEEVHAMIMEARAEGKTVFLSSHLLSQVERVADRVGILKEGRLVVVEDVNALKAKASRFLEAHFSSPVAKESFLGVPGVKEVHTVGSILQVRIEGGMGPLVRALGEHDLVTLVSHEPDLEEIFLEYYGRNHHAS